ncbi:MAG: hypothetical protein H7281_09760 [Bacteriovorax sp.]|nr:hypothetical protein [Bacteriovorax sp.]
MRILPLAILMFAITSCSTLKIADVNSSARTPADETATCTELIKNTFMSENYDKNLTKVLTERKLITFTEKRVQIQYPHLEWINKVKKSFNTSLRNWNNNRYPAFYIFQDEEIIPMAKKYAENLEKILTNQIPLEDDETSKAYLAVGEWMKSFQNYKQDVDQLIEERISLQYNISLLKKLKLDAIESRDIQITIKRSGVLKSEIITLRNEDKNLKFTINKLKQEMKDLDGTLLKNGQIKDRIVRQAMLLDMLNIVQRELEYSTKNAVVPNEEVLKELEKLNQLIKNSDYSPTTYGVYKITNKIFIRELIATSKLDVAYTKIKEPLLKLKTFAFDFFKNKAAGTDEEKIGIFKKIYLKITSITAKQATIGGGSLAVAGFGFERYYWFKEKSTKEVTELPPTNELNPDDVAHEQQLEHTDKVDTEKHDAHSSVVEVQIDELTK